MPRPSSLFTSLFTCHGLAHFVGHCVKGGLKGCEKAFDVEPSAFIDIKPIAQRKCEATGTGAWALADITELVLKKPMLNKKSCYVPSALLIHKV